MTDLVNAIALCICIFIAIHTSLVLGLITTAKKRVVKYSLAFMSASYSALAFCYINDTSCSINPYVSIVIVSTGVFFLVLFMHNISLTEAIDKK